MWRRSFGRRLVLGVVAMVVGCATVAISGPSANAVPDKSNAPAEARGRTNGYFVYWDFNEEEDFLHVPSGQRGALIPPWDPNGQMCIVPDHSGRFVVGYNPTLPSQHNPGSLLPLKNPPVGEAMYDKQGNFTGQTMFTPGPYALSGSTVGGDIPPDVAGGGAFNNNGTMTGCAFDHEGNLFATDLGTAQGDFPPPDDGRLIEWFAPSYTTFCIVDGPTTGGVGAHHVDGHGGLRQPGDMAVDPRTDDILLPQAGSPSGFIGGQVLRIAHASLPARAADCGPDGLYPRERLQVTVMVQGTVSFLPFPIGIARDPSCDCWGVSTVFGDPAIVWVHDDGSLVAGRGSVPGETLTQIGDPNGYNPFGLAFAPDGTLYFIDIHIACRAPLVGCGPGNQAGRLMRVTVTGGQPSAPVPLATGLDFPTSVTVCVSGPDQCPMRPPGHA